MALRRIKTLSGGQKSRVALAIVTYRQFFGGMWHHVAHLDVSTCFDSFVLQHFL